MRVLRRVPRLQVRLHLGQVKVRPNADLEGLVRVVEKVEAKVEERRGRRHAVHKQVLLLQVPAARPESDAGQGRVRAGPSRVRGLRAGSGWVRAGSGFGPGPGLAFGPEPGSY